MRDEKARLADRIAMIKREKGLTWKTLADHAGRSPVWTCALCLGQMSATPEIAAKLAAALGLDEADRRTLEAVPHRGSLPPGPPADPLIYRFHELVQVYGTTWKELIGEEFGDGIMSAIDFGMSVEREPNPAGDRVRIVMSGKFLPYKAY